MSSSHAGKSLFPGYKQVESFRPDDEYESEEEELYVMLDLGTIEPSLLPSSDTYRLIGLDTPTPFLQLSGTILKGDHMPLLGSALIFKDAEDSTGAATKSIEHVATTSHRIRFRPVQLRPKTQQSTSSDTAEPTTDVSSSMAVNPGDSNSGTGALVPGTYHGRGRPKSEKKRREEARQLMETMEEMTGVKEARDPLSIRAKPGPKGKGTSLDTASNEGKGRGKGKRKVEIAVWDEDVERGEPVGRGGRAMPPPAAPRVQRARRSSAFTGSYAIHGGDDISMQQAGPSSEVPEEEELDYMDES